MGRPRLLLVNQMLAHDDYAAEPRASLARLDTHLGELGYDAAAHDKARLKETYEDQPTPSTVSLRRRGQPWCPWKRKLPILKRD